jgi:hypothetical protein
MSIVSIFRKDTVIKESDPPFNYKKRNDTEKGIDYQFLLPGQQIVDLGDEKQKKESIPKDTQSEFYF